METPLSRPLGLVLRRCHGKTENQNICEKLRLFLSDKVFGVSTHERIDLHNTVTEKIETGYMLHTAPQEFESKFG